MSLWVPQRLVFAERLHFLKGALDESLSFGPSRASFSLIVLPGALDVLFHLGKLLVKEYLGVGQGGVGLGLYAAGFALVILAETVCLSGVVGNALLEFLVDEQSEHQEPEAG